MNVAHNRGACASVCKCYALCIVCIAVGSCVWDAANYCALLGFVFVGSEKMNRIPCVGCNGNKQLTSFRFFFFSYLYKFVDYV